MSFQDKISALMARPGQDLVSKEDVPWWMKFSGRALGTAGGLLAICMGFLNCVYILGANVDALLAGLWLVIAGFIILCCEAPCCCMFIDHVQRLADIVDRRPYWNRALGYIILAIPPVIIEQGFGILFASMVLFITGVIYGMMALGRKASAEEMRQAAVAQSNVSRPTNNLVANAQPISFTGAPVFDSNV